MSELGSLVDVSAEETRGKRKTSVMSTEPRLRIRTEQFNEIVGVLACLSHIEGMPKHNTFIFS
jgi:hypothetical protein